MGRDRILAEPFLQRERNTLGPAAAQGKDQRRLMIANQLRDRIVHCIPMRMGRECPQLRPGGNHFDIEIAADGISPHDFHRPRMRGPPSYASVPARNAASVVIGFNVAESPMRTGRGIPLRRTIRSSRSSVKAR